MEAAEESSVQDSPALDALIEGIQNEVDIQKLSRLYTRYVLSRKNGNKVHAAAALGIDRRTIQRWSKQPL